MVTLLGFYDLTGYGAGRRNAASCSRDSLASHAVAIGGCAADCTEMRL